MFDVFWKNLPVPQNSLQPLNLESVETTYKVQHIGRNILSPEFQLQKYLDGSKSTQNCVVRQVIPTQKFCVKKLTSI